MNSEYHPSAVSDAELMGVIANVQGTVIMNRSLDWTSYTDCSVTCACLLTTYSFIHVSVDFCYCNMKRLVL